jgi:glycosyltransferase involved in cell wall biosynthesis
LKIIHIISALPIGGAEQTLFNLVSQDINLKNKHIVISLSSLGPFGEKITETGVRVIRLGVTNIFSSVLALFKLYKFINNMKPDVIQGWMYQGNLVAWISRSFFYRKACLVWGIRHSLDDIFKETSRMRFTIRVNRALSKNPDAIVYNSRVSMGQHEGFGFSSDKSLLIANGFDSKLFAPSLKISSSYRRELGIPDSSLVIGNFGRFHPMKNHIGFLMAALDLLLINKDLHFILVGNGIDSKNIELNKLIPSEFLNSFHFLGARNDVPDLMKTLDILCVASKWGEGLPNVIGEAMLTEVICLSTEVGDSKYIIGDLGIVFPPDDHNSLLCALKESIFMNKEDRINLCVKARKRIISAYSIEIMTNKFNNLYDRLIN